MANSFINKMNSRVSCRSYSSKKVPLSKVNQILDAGRHAPSAMNNQIALITCVRRKSLVEALRTLSKDVMDRDCMYGANTIVLVSAPREDKFCVQDSSCILENIFLSATSLKVDSCWINQFDVLLGSANGAKLKKRLGIPEDHRIVGSATLGYRKDSDAIEIKNKENIKINLI